MKKNKKNKFVFAGLLLSVFFLACAANGAGPLVPCGIGAGNADCTLCHLVVGFKNIYDYLLEILLVCSTVVIVAAGIMYMVSSGDKGMIEKAKSAFTYALTAIILALTAWLIINATLNALGFKQAGNWWTFTCDTTQTTGAGTTGPGGTTLPPSPPGQGCAGAVTAAQGMMGWTYDQSRRNQGGYADCSSLVSRAYKQAGCSSPGDTTADMYPKAGAISDPSSLKAGDLIIYPGHVMMCENNGCGTIIHASMSRGMVLESNSSWALSKSGIKVLRASDFCNVCFLIKKIYG